MYEMEGKQRLGTENCYMNNSKENRSFFHLNICSKGKFNSQMNLDNICCNAETNSLPALVGLCFLVSKYEDFFSTFVPVFKLSLSKRVKFLWDLQKTLLS